MSYLNYFVVFLFSIIVKINGHGMMVDPPFRGNAWQHGFSTPVNYDDTEVFCGGIGVQYEKNQGKCGPCGDDYSQKQPRSNENGGHYGTGVIVKTYTANTVISIDIHFATSHLGYFEFSLCPIKNNEWETEDCFNKYPLYLINGERHYPVTSNGGHNKNYTASVVLPNDLYCDHCSLRWHYRAGNNWGMCPDEPGVGRMGCGNQETYRNCADITIKRNIN